MGEAQLTHDGFQIVELFPFYIKYHFQNNIVSFIKVVRSSCMCAFVSFYEVDIGSSSSLFMHSWLIDHLIGWSITLIYVLIGYPPWHHPLVCEL